MKPKRPILRYHGGKWLLAPWIIERFPAHKVYVEPFGGAGSVLMRKPRSPAEVYNDLDEEIVNLFAVLRDQLLAGELRRKLELTPYSRVEFRKSYEKCTDPVERARRRLVRAAMAFGTTSGRANRTGFRATPFRNGGSTGVQDWANYPTAMDAFTERLRGVVIECRPALEAIRQQDGHDVLFYIDPPYPHSTRSAIRFPNDRERAYAHDMADDDHRRLAAALHGVSGMVVLSGYPCELYDQDLYNGWQRHTRETVSDGARPRTEVLWLNPACVAALDAGRSQQRLIA